MRLNIEEDCFSRLSKFVDLMGIDAREAIGTLVFLWHDSQDILQTEGTFEQIVDWCRITKLPESEQSRWIRTLCKARFLTEVREGTFLIHGNESQIDNRLKHLSKSRKGGESTRVKWEEKKKATAIATGLAQVGPGRATGRLKTMQGKAMQDNAKQDKNTTTNGTTATNKFVAEEYPEEFKPVSAELVVKEVTLRLVLKWKELYGAEWVVREIQQALVWEIENPLKVKKDFPKFMGGWLSRGWKDKKAQAKEAPPVVSKVVVNLK